MTHTNTSSVDHTLDLQNDQSPDLPVWHVSLFCWPVTHRQQRRLCLKIQLVFSTRSFFYWNTNWNLSFLQRKQSNKWQSIVQQSLTSHSSDTARWCGYNCTGPVGITKINVRKITIYVQQGTPLFCIVNYQQHTHTDCLNSTSFTVITTNRYRTHSSNCQYFCQQ